MTRNHLGKFILNIEQYLVNRLTFDQLNDIEINSLKKNNIPSPSLVLEKKLKKYLLK